MRALKVLVVVMGILILAGVTVIVVTIVRRATGPSATPATAATIGDLKFPLPPGAMIEEQSLEGDRFVVRMRLADGTIRLMVFDLAHGRELGRVDFVPQTR